jgi:hypothetical protein
MAFDPNKWQSEHRSPDADTAATDPATTPWYNDPAVEFAGALPQGLLDYAEGPVQAAEHYIPGVRSVVNAIPGVGALRQYRQWTGSTLPGQLGELGGNIAGAALAGPLGEIADASSLPRVVQAARAGWNAMGAGTRGLLAGGASSAAMPVSDPNAGFTGQKLAQLGLGGLLGSWLGGVAGRQAERVSQRAGEEAKNRIAELSTTAAADVPRRTTMEWWKRALGLIGKESEAPAELGPHTSDEVRGIISERRNNLLSRMSFNADPYSMMADRSRLALDEIRASAPDKADWNEIIERPMSGVMTGKRLSDYLSDIGARAEILARQARADPKVSTELYQQVRALRRAQSFIEDRAIGDNPTLRHAWRNTNKSYNMWSIGNDVTGASKEHIASPKDLQHEWEQRQTNEGYSGDVDPWNRVTKKWLQDQHTAHAATYPKIPESKMTPTRPPTTPAEAGVTRALLHSLLYGARVPGAWGWAHALSGTTHDPGGLYGLALRAGQHPATTGAVAGRATSAAAPLFTLDVTAPRPDNGQ